METETKKVKMTRVKAIKTYFEDGQFGRRVTMEELKALEKDAVDDLGRLAAAELNVELETRA